MVKLTPAQTRVLGKMSDGHWVSAYALQERLATLEALQKKRLVTAKYYLGYIWSPRTEILWCKTDDQN
jgi:hypothetical protein